MFFQHKKWEFYQNFAELGCPKISSYRRLNCWKNRIRRVQYEFCWVSLSSQKKLSHLVQRSSSFSTSLRRLTTASACSNFILLSLPVHPSKFTISPPSSNYLLMARFMSLLSLTHLNSNQRFSCFSSSKLVLDSWFSLPYIL